MVEIYYAKEYPKLGSEMFIDIVIIIVQDLILVVFLFVFFLICSLVYYVVLVAFCVLTLSVCSWSCLSLSESVIQ